MACKNRNNKIELKLSKNGEVGTSLYVSWSSEELVADSYSHVNANTYDNSGGKSS